METNQFEFLLAKHQQATRTLLDDFKSSLSIHRQNHLSSHIGRLEQQISVQQEKCKKDFEEEFAKIQQRKKGITAAPHLRMYERAEASLRTQCEQSLASIEELCRTTITDMKAL